MAISRSLMNRQLQANGGIMQVAPRENFGLGSSIKKFARKIIPNEVAEIAVKAAPFVAPFNPAVAAAMSGIGTFDQTGSIGDSLKGGALTYGLGQGARYIGGAGFQGNPFTAGGAFTAPGFTQGFSSPIGTQTGLGKLFSNQGTKGVQGVSVDSGRGGTSSSALARSSTNAPGAEALASEVVTGSGNNPFGYKDAVTDVVTGSGNNPFGYKDAVTESISIMDPSSTASKARAMGDTILKTTVDKSVVAKEPGFLKNMFDGVANQDYGKVARAIGKGAKKFGKAMFTNKDGGIDKAAVMGAIAFAGSYAEAKALAAETGVDMDLTEADYDELTKADKQEEYAGYLTNFFGGQKDGGRIGFKDGLGFFDNLKSGFGQIFSGETQAFLGDDQEKINEFNVLKGYGIDLPEDTIKMIVDGYKKGLDISTISSLTETDDKTVGDIITMLNVGIEKKAYGGRIGFKFGSEPKDAEVGIMTIDVEAGDDEDEEDMDDLMAGITFSSAEKSYLFRRLGATGGSSRSSSMPNLYRILSNPGAYPNDAAILKQIAIQGLNKKDGGRIGFKDGTPDNTLEEILATDMTISNNPNDPRNMTTEEIIAVINSGRSTPELFEELLLRNTGGVNEIDMDEGQAFSFNERGATSDGAIENLLFKLRESNPDIYGDYNRPRKFLPTAEPKFYAKEPRADGGRIGFAGGSGSSDRVAQLMLERDFLLSKDEDVSFIDAELERDFGIKMKAEGGIMEAKIPTGQIRKNNAGVVERDYRDEGGFVPVGIKERADDVPAMLSKNEFVMTADAVRGIGNGSVEEGSKKLYNTMKQAEKVGKA